MCLTYCWTVCLAASFDLCEKVSIFACIFDICVYIRMCVCVCVCSFSFHLCGIWTPAALQFLLRCAESRIQTQICTLGCSMKIM